MVEHTADPAPPLHPRRPRPFTVRMGKKLRPRIDGVIARFSRVEDRPVLDPSIFPWTAALEQDWEAIREEARRLLAHRDAIPPLDQISPDHARIAGDGKWQSFFLYGYGYRIEENCARAPQTAALAEQVPGLNSAFFSILGPGCHIPRHKGVTKGILTCHLGLIVPEGEGRCRMVVGGETVEWGAGKCLAFDDTYPHEVWNDSDESRVVLLIQFARPTRFPGNLIARLFLGGIRKSAFVQEARRNLGKWEDAYRRAEQREGQ